MGSNICFIVPAFNECESIENVIDSIRLSYPNSVICIINDNSGDNTANLARKKGAVVINLINNLGIGGAVQTGLIYAKNNNFDLAVQFDGDGQHIATEVHKIISPIIMGESNYCIGSRWKNKTEYKSSFMRRVGIYILSNLVSRKTKHCFTDVTSGFRAFDNKTINLLAGNYPKDYPEVTAILIAAMHDLKMKEVSVDMQNRIYGKSSIKTLSALYYMSLEIFTILFYPKRKDYQ